VSIPVRKQSLTYSVNLVQQAYLHYTNQVRWFRIGDFCFALSSQRINPISPARQRLLVFIKAKGLEPG